MNINKYDLRLTRHFWAKKDIIVRRIKFTITGVFDQRFLPFSHSNDYPLYILYAHGCYKHNICWTIRWSCQDSSSWLVGNFNRICSLRVYARHELCLRDTGIASVWCGSTWDMWDLPASWGFRDDSILYSFCDHHNIVLQNDSAPDRPGPWSSWVCIRFCAHPHTWNLFCWPFRSRSKMVKFDENHMGTNGRVSNNNMPACGMVHALCSGVGLWRLWNRNCYTYNRLLNICSNYYLCLFHWLNQGCYLLAKCSFIHSLERVHLHRYSVNDHVKCWDMGIFNNDSTLRAAYSKRSGFFNHYYANLQSSVHDTAWHWEDCMCTRWQCNWSEQNQIGYA